MLGDVSMSTRISCLCSTVALSERTGCDKHSTKTATVSSLPYSLNALSGTSAKLRLGSNVPIPQSSFAAVNAPTSVAPITSYSYQSVGSNIDCRVSTLSDGRYRLSLAIEDSSLGDTPGVEAGTAKLPVIRSYQFSTELILRDGQMATVNVATDKVSGETIRAQVTVTSIK